MTEPEQIRPLYVRRVFREFIGVINDRGGHPTILPNETGEKWRRNGHGIRETNQVEVVWGVEMGVANINHDMRPALLRGMSDGHI